MVRKARTMLYKFRICIDPELPDDAIGWIVARSELEARERFGCSVSLARMPGDDTFGLAPGTIIQTGGRPLKGSRAI